MSENSFNQSSLLLELSQKLTVPFTEVRKSIFSLDSALKKTNNEQHQMLLSNVYASLDKLDIVLSGLFADYGIQAFPEISEEELTIERTMDQKIAKLKNLGQKPNFSILVVKIKNYDQLFEQMQEDETIVLEKVLKQTISSSLSRQDDMIIGFEKDSFILWLPNTDKAGAHFVCDRISKNIIAASLTIKGLSAIDVDYGFARYFYDGETPNALVSTAMLSIGRQRKVLILDDDRNFAIDVEKAIISKDIRYICNKIDNGKNILNLIFEDIPDLIIAEITAPGMSGYELVGLLKTNVETKNIPIILVSKYDIENTQIKTLLPNTIPVLNKTKGVDELLRLVLNNL